MSKKPKPIPEWIEPVIAYTGKTKISTMLFPDYVKAQGLTKFSSSLNPESTVRFSVKELERLEVIKNELVKELEILINKLK